MGRSALGPGALLRDWGSVGKEGTVVLIRYLKLLNSTSLPSPHLNFVKMPFKADKENSGKIASLEEEKRHYEEQLRRRTEEVEMLKREKARLERSVRDKQAIAAAKKQ